MKNRFQGILSDSRKYLENMISFAELTEQQKRQLLDAEAVFEALDQAEAEARRHRGSMFWREQAGRKYLKRMFERFTSRKNAVEERVRQSREEMGGWRRMKKALRIGRTPDLLVDWLNVLARAGVGLPAVVAQGGQDVRAARDRQLHRRQRQGVVATNGEMARTTTVHPVTQLVRDYVPHLRKAAADRQQPATRRSRGNALR